MTYPIKETLSGLGIDRNPIDRSFGICFHTAEGSNDICGNPVKNTDHRDDIVADAKYGHPYVTIYKRNSMQAEYYWICSDHRYEWFTNTTDSFYIYEVDADGRVHLLNPDLEEWTMVVRVQATHGMTSHAIRTMTDNALRSALRDYADAGKSEVTSIDSMPVEVN